ncbi:MAG: Rieske 2Fe-2S domain-containing protein [Candidatus Acidiferrum sp.]
MTFRKVATLEDLWSGEMRALDVDGNSILLVNIDDHVYAYANVCPHQKSRLIEGSLIGKTLRCARHHWEFDVCTGNGINPQNACLKAFPVSIESRDILLDLDDERPTESAVGSSENAR